jgi:prophage regulatory protein
MKTEKGYLPEIGFLRVKEILKIFPIGKSTWWDGVKDGRFPKPVKLGERTTAWAIEDIKTLVESYKNQNGGKDASL